MDSFLELIFQSGDERKKKIYFLLTILLSTVIASKIYGRYIEAFEIIPITEYQKIILEFFFTGRFVICLIVFGIVYHIFYPLFDFFLFKYFAKKTDDFYEFIVQKYNKDDIIHDIKTSKFVKSLAEWSIRSLKQLGFIQLHNLEIKPGANFYTLLRFFRKINDKNDNKGIDVYLTYLPIPIILQLLLLFNLVAIDSIDLAGYKIILINILAFLILVVQFLLYFANIFLDLKCDKILKLLEQFEQKSIINPTMYDVAIIISTDENDL